MDIKQTSVKDAQALSEFYRQNSDHLRIWEPRREEGFHSIEAWVKRLIVREQEQAEGRAAYFIACSANSGEIIATCSLTNIVQAAFQACYMGYSVAEEYQGKGVMKKLCHHVIDYAFNERQLNRIMANYMPKNHRSAALLKRLGFTKEGVAKRYLLINGRWEDHILTALLNPNNDS